MDQVIAKAGEYLVGLGLPGILLLGAGYMLHRMFELNNRIQEARINEMKDAVRAIESNTRALEGLTEALRGRRRNPLDDVT